MKKIVKLLLIILILFIILELIFYIFKSSHETEYTLKNNNKEYQIQEIFKNKKYYLKITSEKDNYYLEINNNFHKHKKIIENIEAYQKDDLHCIYPVLEDKDEQSNIVCSINGKTFSYESKKDKLKDFVNTLINKGYKSKSWEEASNSSKKIGTLIAYQDNIKENTYIYIYKYNGFYTISKNNLEQLNLFENDIYLNNLGINVGKYYIIPNYNQKYEYDEILRIDMTKNKVKTIKSKYKISKDSYINGVVDNEIYLFDKDELKQYTINPKKKKVKEVGNKEDGVLNYNLEFETIDVYTMRDEEIKFNNIDNYISKIENTSSIKYIEKANDTYYYQDENNNIYSYNTNSNIKVLLLNIEISDFKLVNDTLYFINEDSLYSYDNQNGLRKLITYSELDFNPENRISIYME